MGRIRSSIGLATGIDIDGTVESLMKIAARPRDLLESRTKALEKEQVAVTELSALLLTAQYIGKNLGKTELFDKRAVSTSDTSRLAATVTGSPAKGNYQFTPLRTVQSQQLLSDGVRSSTQALGGGTITMRFGDNVERSTALEDLDGGSGFAKGKIRITDRSGASVQVDLTTAQTLDEVLQAINSQTEINVTAQAYGDRIRLVDNTGQSVANLKVQEVSGGTTAASLGLDGIDAASAVADGRDIVRLSRDLDLDSLGDGTGVRTSRILADIQYTLRDGTTGTIDFSPILSGTTAVETDETLGDVLDRVNAAAPGKLELRISDDGERLEMIDHTTGEGTFELSAVESEALADLGLDGEAADGVITGRRLLGGLKSVLLSSLNGGKGFGELGTISLTDRSGASDTVDLSSAETLDDVVARINEAEVGISARINAARNGIELTDTTGSSAGKMTVASEGDLETAEALGLAVDAATSSHNTGDLHLQVIAENTRLDTLNGGKGVARGTFLIVDGNGQPGAVNLGDESIQTVGDVITAINRLPLAIRAEINPTGDGIRIVDTSGPNAKQTLMVVDSNSTTAADLHLVGKQTTAEIDGVTTKVIDGSITEKFVLDATASLEDLMEEINKAGAGVTASIFSDGSSKPYRLSLTSDQAGTAGAMVVDISGLGLGFTEAVRAQDALLVYGDVASGANIMVRSTSNKFDSVIPGVTLEIKQGSTQPVTVTVSQSDVDLVANVKTLVENYNKFRDHLADVTYYDPETNKGSVLTGDATALRLDTDLSRIFTDRKAGLGSVTTLQQVGIGLNDDGTLTLDESKLKSLFASDPEGVKEFFTNETMGFSARFNTACEQLVGQDVSLMARRFITLGDKIDANQEKLDDLDARLEKQREALLLSYYRMEVAISKIQNSASYLDQVRYMSADGSYSE